jgi:hypothetical protein
MSGGAAYRSKVAYRRYQNPVSFAPPAPIVEPERMALMARTCWPGRVDEEIVKILLRIAL